MLMRSSFTQRPSDADDAVVSGPLDHADACLGSELKSTVG